MAKRPTEEDLDLGPTPEEQAALGAPAAGVSEDDEYPIQGNDEDDPASNHLDSPRAEDKPGRVKDPVTGKFVAKDKAEPGPVVEGEPAKETPRTVDLRALQEERALRRQTEDRMNQLLEVINKREARAKAEEPKPPEKADPDVDPWGYIKEIGSRLDKFEGESKAQTEARQQYEAQESEYQQVMSVAGPQFAEAVAADPSVEQLQAALLDNIGREICFVNGIPLPDPANPSAPRATPQQIRFVADEVRKFENSHIAYAVKSGQNVVDYMRRFAATRNVTIAPPAPAQQEQARVPNVQAPRAIADRREAQSRHMSLGSMSGSAAPGALTGSALGKMSDAEFKAVMKSMTDKEADELFLKA